MTPQYLQSVDMIIVNCDEFDGDCMIGMMVSPIAADCHDLNDNYDDDHYHDNHNDCFDDLSMILTLEGFLHLSISWLMAGRPQSLQDRPSWYHNLQRRADPFEKQEFGNLWIQAPTSSPLEETNVAQA